MFNGTYEESGRGNTNTDSDDGGHFWRKRVYFCAGNKYATPEMSVDSSSAGLRSSLLGFFPSRSRDLRKGEEEEKKVI